ncbi:GNAT family N-acetyltransferase [Chitinivorax sp. B]|uniref:GNAT family N-acetyltransferase n=1 Tax=Chitinivorax sp. B TaxID=2502235 RepID=UPI0010FA53A3|nr:GNAT family N-acetyltransferase [Chitinivorax sp. B]
MTITIVTVEDPHHPDLDRCDGGFWVTETLQPNVTDGKLGYVVIPIDSPYEKRYADVDDENDNDEPSDARFLAYVNGKVAGQLSLSRHWNGFACIDDIVVDKAFRRFGVGRHLVSLAIEWSRQQGLPGVTLETQSNNVAACRLYERCGFVLKGFDSGLYQGLNPQTSEIALFWYWQAPDNLSSPNL